MLFGSREILNMFVSKRQGTNISKEANVKDQRLMEYGSNQMMSTV